MITYNPTQAKIASYMKAAFALSDSASTAMFRGTVSAPTKALAQQDVFNGQRVLHMGAGRENNPDREHLDGLASEVVHYDPNYGKDMSKHLGKGDFDVVYSPYVLNVLPPKERKAAINDVVSSLREGGKAYFAVRSTNDISGPRAGWKKHKDGFLIPGRGAFQRGFNTTQLQSGLAPYFDEVESVGGVGGHSTMVRATKTARAPGKRMHGATYLHRDYAGIPDADIPEGGEDYTVVKKKNDGRVTLIHSPDFDTAHEPIAEWGMDLDTGKKRKINQHYHHKWQFVGDDYEGFNVLASKDRSDMINQHIKPSERSTMGRPQVWQDISKRFPEESKMSGRREFVEFYLNRAKEKGLLEDAQAVDQGKGYEEDKEAELVAWDRTKTAEAEKAKAHVTLEGRPDSVAGALATLGMMNRLGSWGSSRTLDVPVDGDGPFHLKVDVKELSDAQMGKLLEANAEDTDSEKIRVVTDKDTFKDWDGAPLKTSQFLGNTLRAAAPVAGAIGGAALGHEVGHELGGEAAETFNEQAVTPEAFQHHAADQAARQMGFEPTDLSRRLLSVPTETGMVDLEPARQQFMSHNVETGEGLGGVVGAGAGGLAGFGLGKAVTQEPQRQPTPWAHAQQG